VTSTEAKSSSIEAVATAKVAQSPTRVSFALLLTLVFGLATTSLLFRSFVEVDRNRVQEALEEATLALAQGSSQATYMDGVLAELNAVLGGIQDEVAQGAPVTAELLEKYRWTRPPPGLETTSLEYLPRILQAELNDPQRLRERLGNNENASFPLLEKTGKDLRPVRARAEYFPVLIEAPYAKPQATISLDYAADTLHRLALDQARDTGLLTSSSYFPTTMKGDTLITRYFVPLYEGNEPLDSIVARRARHIGFISAVTYIPAETMIAFLPESYQGIETAFFTTAGDFSPAAISPEFQQAYANGDIMHATYLVNGAPFHLATRVSANMQQVMTSNNRWWVLSIGLLMTAWMSSIVVWSAMQKQKIIKVVEERTRDLAAQTHKLSEVNSALSESESRYRMLANNISDVIYTHDMEGLCTYISPSIKQQNGFEVGDYIGRPIYSHLVPESAARTKAAIGNTVRAHRSGRQLLLGSHPHVLETFSKDGTIKHLETTISGMYHENGELIGFMGVMRDITARKKAEKEKELLQNAYRQAQKMEAIGTLAGGIAHDFNNLLTGVIGHADLLKLEFSEHPSALHSLDVIEMAAIRAKDLTSQLLGFARKGQFQSVPVEIEQVLSEVISLMERTMNKNIEIIKIDNDSNPVVLGDPAQISQIFLNLAVNARDAMPKGGKLAFETRMEELDDTFCRAHLDTVPGKYCVISVSDTGVGIAPDKIEHIFEPFFTTKTDGKGTGLGLAMVYGVTKNHNGTVSVYSEIGKGSIFKVYLPASTVTLPVYKKTKGLALVQGSGNILLVDDQEIVRQIGAKMLCQLGYSVTEAEDGAKGLEVYASKWQDIDLVIVDMIMPNMGGLECVEAMHRLNPDLKVILTSGFSRDSIADKINEAHIMGFLQKPFRLQELSELVAAIHHR